MDLAIAGNEALLSEPAAGELAEQSLEDNTAGEKPAEGKGRTRAKKRTEPPVMPKKHWPTSSV